MWTWTPNRSSTANPSHRTWTTSTRSSRSSTSRCPPTATSTVSSAGSGSTSACSNSARTARSPARARELPGDLRLQPRRVLHGPVAGLKRRIDTGSPSRPTSACTPRRPAGHRREGARAAGPPRAGVHRVAQARPRRRRHPRRALVRPGRGRPAADARVLQRADLPGADAVGGRPGAPVPVHLRSVAQPRGAGAQPEVAAAGVRAPQGAAELLPLHQAAGRQLRASAVHPARRPHREPPRRPVPGDGGPRAPRVPGHPERGRRDRGGRGENLIQALERELLRRRFGPPIRSRSPRTWTR